jgi:hypothetical protein
MTRFTSAFALAAVLGFAAPAYAVDVNPPVLGASDSQIDQINNGNSASVSQTASGGAGNASAINQAGDDTATVTQSGGPGTLNSSQIDQSGDNNTSNTLTGLVVGAAVTQGGVNNENTSTITQGSLGGNTASVNQGLLGSDSENESHIIQNGSDGAVLVDQTGTAGTSNESHVTQFNGDANEAIVNQSGAGLTNFSNIGQAGDSNYASVTQN